MRTTIGLLACFGFAVVLGATTSARADTLYLRIGGAAHAAIETTFVLAPGPPNTLRFNVGRARYRAVVEGEHRSLPDEATVWTVTVFRDGTRRELATMRTVRHDDDLRGACGSDLGARVDSMNVVLGAAPDGRFVEPVCDGIVRAMGAEMRPAQPAMAVADGACMDRVAGLSRALGTIADAPALSILADAVPTTTRGEPVVEVGPVVNIQRSFPVVLDFENLQADDDDAANILASRIRPGVPVYVAMWPDEPASRVRVLLGPLARRGQTLRLLVAEPQPSTSQDDIGATIGRLTAAMGSCVAATRVVANAAGQAGTGRFAYIRSQMPEAVRSCGCVNMDVEALSSVLVALGETQTNYRFLPLRLSDAHSPSGADERVVRLPAGASARDLVVAITSGSPGAPITLSIE